MNTVDKKDQGKKQKMKQLEKNLSSSNPNVVSSAIKQLRKEGNEKFIPLLIETMVNTAHKEIKQEIIVFLNDLKETAAAPYIIEAIKNEDYKDYRSILLGVFWQSSLDASEYLSFLVDQAVKGDFMTCLEALTVIENLEGTFTEEEIMDATYTVTEHLDEAGEDKQKLLTSLQESLQKLNVEY